MANRTIRTDENRALFINTLQECGNIRATCEATGLARRSIYDWRDEDPEFASAWDAAVKRGLDGLEDVAIERARQGSDLLLIFLLKAHRPERYREVRQLDITQRLAIDYRGLSIDEIRQRLAELRQRQDGAVEGLGPMIEADNIIDLDAQR